MEGYKKKPVLIEIFAVLYLLNPLGNFLLIKFLNPSYTPAFIVNVIINYVKHGNIIVIIILFLWLSAIPLAFGLFKVRLWAWYYFIIHSVAMFAMSFVSISGFRPSVATIINFIFLIPIGYFISKEVRVPYFNPRLRWWEQNKRFLHSVNVKVDGLECSTYDLSETGAFIKVDGLLTLAMGALIPITLNLSDTLKIECMATVRWINENSSKYPAGYGVKFEKFSWADSQKLHAFFSDLIIRAQESH